MEIELNQIYNEDCLQTMSRMNSESVDMIITSPPYDDMRKYKGFVFDFKLIALELSRVLKKGGVIVWVVGDQTKKGSESGNSFRQALYFMDFCGLNLHDTMIYEKDSISFPETTRYSQIFEYMFVFSKGKPKSINIIKDRKNKHFGNKKITGGERQVSGELIKKRKGNMLKEFGSRFNIWRYSTGCNKSTTDKIAFNHPAIFPEKLAKDHILSWSNEKDLIYDPFMGSGTVAKMCILSDRYFIGSEISEDYKKIYSQRISGLIPFETRTIL